MKKILIIVIGIIVVSGIIWAGIFYWQNLRGVWPAVLPPTGNIAEVINQSADNTTGLPLKLPPGFSISIFAKGLINPRVMTFDPDSNLLVSITSEGKVAALPDKDVNGVADSVAIVVGGLNRPHGLAFRCEGNAAVQKCFLYIAESDQIAVYDYDRENLRAANKRKIADLPNGGEHFTRTIGFGPDPLTGRGQVNRLYVSIGSDCNVCNESDMKRAKIFSMNPDGSDFKEFAKGLRNTVFFTWHPVTGQMWGTDMGRDFLGDDLPPDEINILAANKNYGWPVCYGQNIHDSVFDKNIYIRNPCMEPFETPSHIDIPAHSAPLGLAFVPEDIEKGKFGFGPAWPKEYWNNLLVAYHGSWNRSAPIGYKVVRYKLDQQGKYLGVEDFITGWLASDGQALGRPAGILVLPGGFVYISDDKAGVIYRVSYK